MSELTRREFLKSIGVVAAGLSLPITLELIQEAPKSQIYTPNYLFVEGKPWSWGVGVKAFSLDRAMPGSVDTLHIVVHEGVNINWLSTKMNQDLNWSLQVMNGVPIHFKGLGRIVELTEVLEGNSFIMELDKVQCLTDLPIVN